MCDKHLFRKLINCTDFDNKSCLKTAFSKLFEFSAFQVFCAIYYGNCKPPWRNTLDSDFLSVFFFKLCEKIQSTLSTNTKRLRKHLGQASGGVATITKRRGGRVQFNSRKSNTITFWTQLHKKMQPENPFWWTLHFRGKKYRGSYS